MMTPQPPQSKKPLLIAEAMRGGPSNASKAMFFARLNLERFAGKNYCSLFSWWKRSVKLLVKP
jgi:hypothetical protein